MIDFSLFAILTSSSKDLACIFFLFHQLTPMHLDSGFTGTKFCSASGVRRTFSKDTPGVWDGKWDVDNARKIILSGEKQL